MFLSKASGEKDPPKFDVISHSRSQIDELIGAKVMIADLENVIIYVNNNLGRLFLENQALLKEKFPDFEPGRVINSNMDVFYDKPGRQREIIRDLESAYTGKIQMGRKMIDLVASPVVDDSGTRQGTMVVWHDVSNNHYFEAKSRAINCSQGVIHFDMDGCVLDANDNFLKVIGYRLDEIQGRHHRMFCEEAYVKSHDYSEFWKKLNQGSFHAGQYKRIGKGGRPVWIEASYNPILGIDGKPIMVIKFATDLTPRKEQNRNLASDFDNNVRSLVEMVSVSADRVNNTSENLSNSAGQTNSQASFVETTTVELAQSMREISTQVDQSASIVARTAEKVEQAGVLMAELLAATGKVNEVTGVIAGIAEQTNLLALNATIEAARAGNAGR